MRRILLIAAASMLAACSSNEDPLPEEATLNLRTPESPPTVEMAPEAGYTLSDEPDEKTVTVQRWDAPDTENYRYYQIIDQTGCRWWMPMPGADDDNGPDPVLGANHRPVCTDRDQEPEGELVEMSEAEAAAEIKAGRAVRADDETIRRIRNEGGEVDSEEDDEEPDPEPSPTPSPRPTATPAPIGRMVVMPNGQIGTTLGGGMVRMQNGRVGYHAGGVAMPVAR